MNGYIIEEDIPWPNVVDDERTLAERYHVAGYPSLFLVDRNGILRVALPHHYGLEPAIRTLLAEE